MQSESCLFYISPSYIEKKMGIPIFHYNYYNTSERSISLQLQSFSSPPVVKGGTVISLWIPHLDIFCLKEERVQPYQEQYWTSQLPQKWAQTGNFNILKRSSSPCPCPFQIGIRLKKLLVSSKILLKIRKM